MLRRTLAVTGAAALMLLAVAHSASADKPSYGCPPGFDLGALALEQVLELPNVVAGIEDGIYDEAFVAAFQENGDRNDDGLLCFQSFPPNASPASLLQYYYNVVDNNASVPSG